MAKLCQGHWAGRSDNESKFETNAKRLENKEELATIIETWLQSFPSREEALDVLAEERIPCAPILDIGESIKHPQTLARGMVTEIEHPVLGKIPIVNTPFELSETPRQIQGPAPLLGRHNAEVLTQFLGYAEAEMEQLKEAGVLIEDERVRELREKGDVS